MGSVPGNIVISICIMFLTANGILACQCKAESSSNAIKKLKKTATVIFTGTVTEVRKEVRDNHVGYWTTFKVKESWKSNHAEVSIFSDGGCMAWFESGRTYLVFAKPDSSNRLSTNVCMRTGLIEYAAEDLKLLGKPKFTGTGSAKQARDIR